MGERNRFAFDRDYYNRIAAEYVNGSAAKKYASEPESETELEEYLTATYAPEYKNSVSSHIRETREASRATRRERAAGMNSTALKNEAAAPAKKPRTAVFGNAAPERKTRTVEKPAEQTEVTPQIKTRYLIRFNYVRFAIIAALIVVVVQSALNLLSVKSDVNRIDKEIAAAKITLEDVNSYNESLLGQLDISYDRNYIYNVAVGRLGMVYPKDNAVVYYKAADTSHVIQYRDIP